MQIKILPLLKGKVILPLVEVDNASLNLLSDAKGRANWNFHPGQKPKPLKLPVINNLIIKSGAVRYQDVKHHLDFAGDDLVERTDRRPRSRVRSCWTARAP